MSKKPNTLVTLPHVRIQNANMISGPYSWGFPAVSNFLGFVHALHRKLGGAETSFDGVGIVCHDYEAQVYQPVPYVPHQLKITRNPYDSNGDPSSTLEEGRIHLDVTLVIGVWTADTTEAGLKELAEKVLEASQSMRIAGGSVLPRRKEDPKPYASPLSDIDDERKEQIARLKRRLIPGFVLVERGDILSERLKEMRVENPDSTALDALLDLCAVKVEPEMSPEEYEDKKAENEDKDFNVTWGFRRERPGWLVPIPVGFLPISELYEPGVVKNARDNEVPFRFVEAAYSMGEWLNPLKLRNAEDLMWYYESDPEIGTYLCKQKNK
ncbi:type I-F CRISPR-associated protein Csy2 [Limisalsivibrio acetivorans]|uniref:type I-F CRISPR-associated protein Csy2 n=1 Tax=Limisalsivibrio acetivorans TaxID=1304888 RepID=UPI0003B39820|nr:type I-F CRISPR-associated protein Csy2 [Limisalsivibrio acetivorans]